MSRKASYSLEDFRKLVIAGKTKSEIIDEMKIKGYPQFSALELRLIKTDKQYYEILGDKSSNELGKMDSKITIGKRGNLVIPKTIIETTKFKEHDSFNVSVKGKKIILTLVDSEEEESTDD